jgi:hypothetical protein
MENAKMQGVQVPGFLIDTKQLRRYFAVVGPTIALPCIPCHMNGLDRVRKSPLLFWSRFRPISCPAMRFRTFPQ